MKGIKVSDYKTNSNRFVLKVPTYMCATNLSRILIRIKKQNVWYLVFKIRPEEGKLCLYKDQHAMSSAAVIAIIMHISFACIK